MLTKDEVLDMQRQLGVKQDGVLGPTTIKALQRKIGVPADGRIGPQTIAALKKAGATLWAAAFQQQLSDAKTFTASKSPLHAAATAPKPAPFAVKPPVTIKVDTAKLGKAALGVLGAAMLAFAVLAGKRMARHA